MSKIVFFCIPAHGHINPTLEVVRELVARGHEVWYYSYNSFREKIEAVGAKFVSCDDYDVEQNLVPEDAARVGKDLGFSIQILVDTTLALDEMVCKDMERLRPDCIVSDSMAVWGKAAALKLNIPFISSTTTFAFNKQSAKIMKQGIKELVGMIVSMPKINKNMKRLQEKGYPVKSFLDIIKSDEQTDTIVYTSAEFQPCAETFSDKYAFVGPSVRLSSSHINKEKEKLVYISMGTVNNNMLKFYENCISAFLDTDYQVIMSVGNLVNIESLGHIPKNISIFNQVDQIAVLSQADVFLSHCGMNSVNESLYYQVPLIMYPQTSEQGGVASRVSQLGAGFRLEKTSPLAIREAVNYIFENTSFYHNATTISNEFKNCTGAKGAADKILQVCQL